MVTRLTDGAEDVPDDEVPAGPEVGNRESQEGEVVMRITLEAHRVHGEDTGPVKDDRDKAVQGESVQKMLRSSSVIWCRAARPVTAASKGLLVSW